MGVTNYFGGYALTGGQGGLAPWLMLGGGVGAGIGGLSGYNQWNANKTEYDDIRKRQKEWDAGLEALTPVGTPLCHTYFSRSSMIIIADASQ